MFQDLRWGHLDTLLGQFRFVESHSGVVILLALIHLYLLLKFVHLDLLLELLDSLGGRVLILTGLVFVQDRLFFGIWKCHRIV